MAVELTEPAITLEELPPHRNGCSQELYLAKQAIFFGLKLGSNPDYDMPDHEFWERFGPTIPACICDRPKPISVQQRVDRVNKVQPFRQTFGPITARTYATVRYRIVSMLVKETGNPIYWGMDLGAGKLAPGVEREAGRSAHQVWSRVRRFEMGR